MEFTLLYLTEESSSIRLTYTQFIGTYMCSGVFNKQAASPPFVLIGKPNMQDIHTLRCVCWLGGRGHVSHSGLNGFDLF